MMSRGLYGAALAKAETFIFDLDGTLLDTLGDLMAACNRALASQGFPPRGRSEIQAFVGNGTTRLLQLALPTDVTLDEAAFAAYRKAYREAYLGHLADETAPYPGILETVSRLKYKDKKLGVLTNKPDEAAKKLVDHFFPNLFDEIRGQRPGFARKPDPQPLLELLTELEADPRTTLYLGDSEVDMMTGKACHCFTVGVTWGYRSREVLEESGADWLIDEPQALLSPAE